MANHQLTSAAFDAQLFAQTAKVDVAKSQAAQAGSSSKISHDEARAAAEDFEAIFLQTMLSPMFAGTQPAEPFGGGFAEETWQGLLVEEYAKTISASGGVGISDAIYSELMSVQEQYHDGRS